MKIRILLAIPYCIIIILVAVVFQDVTISAVTGTFTGLAYFGWVLPHYNKREG